MYRAVFLDRDGVINVNREDHVKCWDEFVWLPGTLEALRLLTSLPAKVMIVTNQSVVGRGIIPLAQLDAIHRRMLGDIHASGGRIDRLYVCPHAPGDGCTCRKPKPGLLHQAQQEFCLDMAASIMIGDRASDIAAGRAAGCRTIRVGSVRDGGHPTPDWVEPDLPAATRRVSRLMLPGGSPQCTPASEDRP